MRNEEAVEILMASENRREEIVAWTEQEFPVKENGLVFVVGLSDAIALFVSQ